MTVPGPSVSSTAPTSVKSRSGRNTGAFQKEEPTLFDFLEILHGESGEREAPAGLDMGFQKRKEKSDMEMTCV